MKQNLADYLTLWHVFLSLFHFLITAPANRNHDNATNGSSNSDPIQLVEENQGNGSKRTSPRRDRKKMTRKRRKAPKWETGTGKPEGTNDVASTSEKREKDRSPSPRRRKAQDPSQSPRRRKAPMRRNDGPSKRNDAMEAKPCKTVSTKVIADCLSTHSKKRIPTLCLCNRIG